MQGPNCYDCIHRRTIPGSAHSKCGHPKIDAGDNPLSNMLSILGSKRRATGPMEDVASLLNVRGNPTGIKGGWFMWPFDFDPIWLLNCDGFESNKK